MKNNTYKHTILYHFVVNFVKVYLADFVDNVFAFVRDKSKACRHVH